MSAARCIKLALLLTLIPLALRATSLLHGGHGAPATPASSSRQSWTARHGGSTRTATIVVSGGGPARGRDRDRDRPYRHATHRRRRIAASGGGTTRRLRQADGGDWFEDDKRLAPTGSNPLHNLR